MKRLVSFVACLLAVLLIAGPASADGPPYAGYSGDAYGENGAFGSWSGSWSVDGSTGEVDIDATATEPGTHYFGGAPWTYVQVSQSEWVPVTPGDYRITVLLSDIDASVSGGQWGTAYVKAGIDTWCACGDPFEYTPIIETNNVRPRSVTMVDGVVELTEDVTVDFTGDLIFSVEFLGHAVTGMYGTPFTIHGGTATADFSATIESMTVTPL